MTDNEIIKALECCFVNKSCNGCPLTNLPKQKCLERACLNALLLINHQQERINYFERVLCDFGLKKQTKSIIPLNDLVDILEVVKGGE